MTKFWLLDEYWLTQRRLISFPPLRIKVSPKNNFVFLNTSVLPPANTFN
jgi:hypothetical protein